MAVWRATEGEEAAERAEDARARRADPARVPAPRPRDAATLLLVREGKAGREILMGQRAGSMSFMPDKWVFPGGRVDPDDWRVPAAVEPRDEDAARLGRDRVRRPARAFGLAAIRETWEEAGLVVGRPAPEQAARLPAGASWDGHRAQGALPDLSALHFIGRAITPPYRHKRFDARFFLARAETCLIEAPRPEEGSELTRLNWFGFAEAMDLDLPSVTRFMIAEAGEVLERGGQPGGAPFLRWTRSGHRMDRL